MGKDHILPVPVETAILARTFLIGLSHDFPIHRRPRHEAMPGVVELDEATAPHHRER